MTFENDPEIEEPNILHASIFRFSISALSALYAFYALVIQTMDNPSSSRWVTANAANELKDFHRKCTNKELFAFFKWFSNSTKDFTGNWSEVSMKP